MDTLPPREPRNPAVLLLGPTGAGKTPLGNLIQERGLGRERHLHFDFGDNLRRTVAGDCPHWTFSAAEIGFLQDVLEKGRLLENEDFHIAARIVQSFLDDHGADRRTVVVLNGLPRHVDQAKDVDSILEVQTVIHLDCTAETVLERIRSNVGGDRSGREDDDLQSVQKKLQLFHGRTAPLLDHYASLNKTITTLVVTPTMTPEDVWQALSG